MRHVDRYVPADTNGGWGIAAGIVALAVVLIIAVTIIHQRTYRHPTTVTWHAKGQAAGHDVQAKAPAH